jgi:hypothetical protein
VLRRRAKRFCPRERRALDPYVLPVHGKRNEKGKEKGKKKNGGLQDDEAGRADDPSLRVSHGAVGGGGSVRRDHVVSLHVVR